MNFTIGNQLEQKQNIALTSKMMEELKILQMPYVELAQYIEDALVENPMLEAETLENWVIALKKDRKEYALPEEEHSLWDNAENKDFTEYTSNTITLTQFLMSQIGEMKLDKQQKRIALYLIGNISDEGYLIGDLKEVALEFGVPMTKVREALSIIQSLDPSGVGARNLKECILLQLRRKNLLNKMVKEIVINHLDLLVARKYYELTRKLSISKEDVLRVQRLIRSLDPKPGHQFHDSHAVPIVPELEARVMGGSYEIVFHDEYIPSLKINSFYKEMMKKDKRNIEACNYLKSKLEKALEITRAIEQRKKTVLNIASFIIEYQSDFLRNGYASMKPLTLKKVADSIGVHESTVSRTVSNKYIQTPRGIFELKYFFSSHADSTHELGTSSNGVKKLIAEIISNEDKANPLSDEQIRKQLEKEGVRIARRTVTKYREDSAIVTSILRKT